jgi:carboxyl-terminal processing protease
MLPSGYGYIRLSLWKSPVYKDFKKALDRLKDAPGIILDLRGNPGGEVNEVLRIAGYFFPDKVPFGRFINRSGKFIALYTRADDDHVYNGAVAVLINESSGSASEMFSGVLQESGRAVVIGRQSCGCLLGIAKYREVEGGGELAISELGYVSPKGKRLEGGGVLPDEQVSLKIADLQRRRDATIEEAEQQLKSAAARVKAAR